MRTAVKTFGPADHGRLVGDEEAAAARYKEGYKYEIIEGRLYVSPVPNCPEEFLDDWLRRKLDEYAARRPDVINFVSNKARVFLPDRDLTTSPEPDLAAYHDFPRNRRIRDLRWEDVSPVLVA